MRDFNAWLSTFRASIADYGYYVDFPKIYKNVEKIKVELNILNSLIVLRKPPDSLGVQCSFSDEK